VRSNVATGNQVTRRAGYRIFGDEPVKLMRQTALSALLVLIVGPTIAAAGELRVKLSGIENDKGEIRVAVFLSDKDFEAERFVAKIKVPAAAGVVEVVFEDIAPGVYGINAFHDKNDNEKLDRNLVGIPKEPYAFSNNAKGNFGPPKFEAVSFEVTSAPQTMEINF
jgi:uncharacterized protein (DUF2141 family)